MNWSCRSSSQGDNSLVVGADTIIFFDNKVFGKPKTANQAFITLQKLSGKTHRVITGVSLLHLEKEIDINFYQSTEVTIKKLKEDEIQYYINNYNIWETNYFEH